MSDPYELQRFVDAQAPVYAAACSELRRGLKTSHWMWFIFPQIAGLGRSAMAQKYALASRAEARAYLEHTTLGPRLRECTSLVNRVPGRSLFEIFGTPDDVKFHSSMTLFAVATRDGAAVAAENQVFFAALEKYCNSELDARTLELLE